MAASWATRWALVAGLIACELACADFGAFTCEGPGDCDANAEGQCESIGWCSYPDDSCVDERRRYGEHAGDGLAGACVGAVPDGTSGPGTSSGSGDTDDPDPADGCDGVSCLGAGRCIEVDDIATCACDPGTYALGLDCVEDPCSEGASCLFVDADDGDDGEDGSRDRPWKTLDRLRAAELAPGTYVLLRRGGTFSQQLLLDALTASLEDPITVGAWGPLGDAPPALIAGVVVSASAGVVLRDLEVTASEGACVQVEQTDGFVARGLWVHDCARQGIVVVDGSTHTVLIDNRVEATEEEGLAVRDLYVSADETISVGDHHYVVDNVLTQTAGLFVLTRGNPGDVKILGNVVLQSTRSGIGSLQGHGWVLGNTAAGMPDGSEDTGRPHALLIDYSAKQQIEGNVFFDSEIGSEADLGTLAIIERNTFVFSAGDTTVSMPINLRGSQTKQTLRFRRNLLLTSGDEQVEIEGGVEFGEAVDNAYVPDSGTCAFLDGETVLTFDQWQALGYDAGSTCGPVPGVDRTLMTVADPAALDDPRFWGPLVPDPGWVGCNREIGAFACTGERHAPQLADLGVDDDWDGIVDVWQRYQRAD